MYDAHAVTVVVERCQLEILEDVARGRVPATVRSFAQLHDHVDANDYGGGCEDYDDSDATCRFWNRVQNAVDAWIKAGGLNG
jgi:hypothetical protein